MKDSNARVLGALLLILCGVVISVWGQPLPSLAAAIIVTAAAEHLRRYSRRRRHTLPRVPRDEDDPHGGASL